MFRREWRSGFEPRFSDALHEQGNYAVEYGDWRPLSLPGDPVISHVMPPELALPACDRLFAMAEGRARIGKAFLARYNLRPRPCPQDWEEVEHLLARLAEPSQEPQHKALHGTVPRPKFWALTFDLGCFYAEALCKSAPGSRLVPAHFGRDKPEGVCPPFPRVAVPGRPFLINAVETAMKAGAAAVVQGWSNSLPQGFSLLAPSEPAAPAREIRPTALTAERSGKQAMPGRVGGRYS
ncbi:hypothetical protein [Paracoccus sp. (in: a-proteobacteria)]|uniref:hypothetical protein n=1 Tax=Paracoccus sp. TaxID=267 RepID=UPI003A8A192C